MAWLPQFSGQSPFSTRDLSAVGHSCLVRALSDSPAAPRPTDWTEGRSGPSSGQDAFRPHPPLSSQIL